MEVTGWLSPQGDFQYCGYGEHNEKAECLSENIKNFLFGYNITPQYSATFSKTIENYGYLKIQNSILFVPDYNGWKDELFVSKFQSAWLSKNIDLTKTITLRIKG